MTKPAATRLLALGVKPTPDAALEERSALGASPESGLEGDFRGAVPGRQVTLLALASWRAACAETGAREETGEGPLDWTRRGANLLVEDLDLAASAGRQLRVGPVLLEVAGAMGPCSKMERLRAGLGAALRRDWRGGIAARIVEGGELKPGDPVAWED